MDRDMTATLEQVLSAVNRLHGDVRVALDRTENQGAAITALTMTVTEHGKEMAATKSQATFFGTLASAVMVGLIEGAKTLFSGHTGNGP